MRLLIFLGLLAGAGVLAWLSTIAPYEYYMLFVALAGLLGVAAGIIYNLPRHHR